MDSNEVNHLFFGGNWLLVSQMIPQIVNNSKYKHHFVIVISNEEQRNNFENLFTSINHTSYEYWVNSFKKGCIVDYFKIIIKCRFVRYDIIKNYLSIFKYVDNCSFSNLIIHSEINDLFTLFLNKSIRISWCCWGHIPTINRKAPLLFLRRSFLYRKFIDKCHRVIVLTDSDKDIFSSKYGYPNVYLTSYSYIYNFDSLEPNQSAFDNSVLIGNSAFYLDEYSKAAELLKNKKGLAITFMCSYGIKDRGLYNAWKLSVKRILEPSNSVNFWEETLDLQHFNKKLATYSIFIAPMRRQSGLGTITTSLRLGLKCYLNDVNLDYFRKKGLNVFDYESISELGTSEFLSKNKSLLDSNMVLVTEVCGVNKSVNEWEQIYESMIH